MNNRLYYGDNLEILRNREYFPDECADLIYLDPPFNSNRNYNVLFKSESGADSEAQITAFEDTWHWGETAEATYDDIIVDAPHKVATAIEALMNLIERNQMMAYLVMMTARLVELHRVLKPTGSLYLHCDPTASHYLKVILDAIFGKENLRTEIVWKRTTAHNDARQGAKQPGRIHDVLFFYTKDVSDWTWNPVYTPYSDDYVDKNYRHIEDDSGRRYTLSDLTAAKPGGDTEYEWRGARPYEGRYWAYSKENMEKFEREGRLHYTRSGVPRYKRYLDEMPGVHIQSIWDDITPIGSRAAERLGYPTQKPEALLERIIRASSDEGDIVLDPFCGCGTAIAAAHKLGRGWIGIDITHLSIALQKYRLGDMFELVSGADYAVIGEPATVEGARELARDSANEGRYQFEWWALSLLRAKPVGGSAGSRRGKKGADQGIDGVINFFDEDDKGKKKPQKAVVQVKSGKVNSGQVQQLKGAMANEGAAIGVFITLERPTGAMTKEALAAGWYESPAWGRKYRRLQILTIGDLFEGTGVEMPPQHGTHARAERWRRGGVGADGESQRDLI